MDSRQEAMLADSLRTGMIIETKGLAGWRVDGLAGLEVNLSQPIKKYNTSRKYRAEKTMVTISSGLIIQGANMQTSG